ncbi:hypothetical protein NI17_003595 [Thermobifida halotolerans]|uniref:Uncharacterized protein n=1 Tax=Thermobifida halotolerans TaxID=483545 RepID=A0AA97LYF2_9ACTN|nr:multidrug effflux MFS transporter [Thermobifida halotolerans]UOE20334.1 hypothetical protein NI17_003595 [Thermobifida halotolerans]
MSDFPDVSGGPAAARLQGVLMITSVTAPVAAPLSGGASIAGAGRRAVFWGQAALTLLTVVGVVGRAKSRLRNPRTSGAALGGATGTLANRATSAPCSPSASRSPRCSPASPHPPSSCGT